MEKVLTLEQIKEIINNTDYCSGCDNRNQECGECDVCMLDDILECLLKALKQALKEGE
ncbi:MAG: hypothetical protein US20_C0005G0026 [Candidatus Pacebacteria bacterium GW2011_GWF1_36_5]|nr:MAG: hypothetical protein US20_C0005G0026 [Candidatus Pacebacteria bacterium GW2011_GWF1_36_5]